MTSKPKATQAKKKKPKNEEQKASKKEYQQQVKHRTDGHLC